MVKMWEVLLRETNYDMQSVLKLKILPKIQGTAVREIYALSS